MPEPSGWEIVQTTDSDDLDAVAGIEAASFTNPWTREMLDREIVQSEVAHIFVARGAGRRVAAFCTCWIVSDELHINSIAVDPDLRGGGLATILMRAVLAEAERRGAHRATLEVRRSNTPARRLYEKLGFSVVAVRLHYYTQPEEDALILWRDARHPGDANRTPTGSNP
jgi:[ribosomal protein S18]-alanine N-acetyltransferase